jgi:ribosomal protein S9
MDGPQTVEDLHQVIRELQHELVWYEKAYRSLLNQVNSLQPDNRIHDLKKSLDNEVRKRQEVSRRYSEILQRNL